MKRHRKVIFFPLLRRISFSSLMLFGFNRRGNPGPKFDRPYKRTLQDFRRYLAHQRGPVFRIHSHFTRIQIQIKPKISKRIRIQRDLNADPHLSRRRLQGRNRHMLSLYKLIYKVNNNRGRFYFCKPLRHRIPSQQTECCIIVKIRCIGPDCAVHALSLLLVQVEFSINGYT